MTTSWTESTSDNSTYNKLAVQWLNEALFFVASSVVADSFRLRNRHLRVAAKRCTSYLINDIKRENGEVENRLE
jgi:hypothetical protein